MISLFKYLGACLVVIGIIVLIVILTMGKKTDNDSKKQAIDLKQSGETINQSRLYFSFDGSKSQIIKLIKGKSELSLIYSGDSKFNAKILNTDGTLFASLVEANGPYNAIHEIEVPEPGAYILDIKISKEWALSK